MPELPEVEVVRRGLEDHIIGTSFTQVEVLHPRANRGQDAPLSGLLVGRSVDSAKRRGKHLWLELDDSTALYVHLGMSGQMLVGEPGVVTSPHVRIRSQLIDVSGRTIELSFVDQRTFGRWFHTRMLDGVPENITHVAPDPFEASFDLVRAARRLRQTSAPVKTALLNQEIVSGVGNIYADESLWLARLKPMTKARAIRQRDAENLLVSARDVMARALAQGGTSFDSLYVNVNGESGYFDRSLNVYGLEGDPCPRCLQPIVRTVIGQRSSHYCPNCQVARP